VVVRNRVKAKFNSFYVNDAPHKLGKREIGVFSIPSFR